MVDRSGLIFYRFIYNLQLYSSVSYTRAKRHSNSTIAFQDEGDSVAYGTIIGLIEVKPHCDCDISSVQYCDCQQYFIVLVSPMQVNNNSLYKDPDFRYTSSFLVELSDTESVVAMFPDQIRCKCIVMFHGQRKFLCPLPFRIYDD